MVLEKENIHKKTKGSFISNYRMYWFKRLKKISCLCFTLISMTLLAQSNISIIKDTTKANKLEEVVVVVKKDVRSAQLQSVIANHEKIAGGTAIAVMQPKKARLETLKDALKLVPGVMIQEFFGANDQPRINIRGSGIQSNPQRRGVYLMQDGIPVNFADGSYIIGVMDPAIAEFVEVFKGANAMQYGTATLGGVIDFVSRKGTAQGNLFVKSETGSFAYKSITVMGGKKWGNQHIHASLSASKQDGFREHNTNKKINLAFRGGYSVGKHITNNWYANYSYINFDIPGPLTYEMLLEDPTQITEGVRLPLYMAANIKRDKPKREVEMVRLANKSRIKNSDKSYIDLAFYYQYANDRFVYPIALSTQHSYSHDTGLTFIWKYNTSLHHFQTGVISSIGKVLRNGHINKNGLDAYLFSKDRLTAYNFTFFVQDKYQISSRIMLVAALQIAYNARNSKDVFSNPDLRPWYSHMSQKYRYFYSENISMDQSYSAINPRIGAIVNVGNKYDYQFFANLSGSYEPPTFDELVGTKVTNNTNSSPKELFAVKLDKQSAVTIELGTRHTGERVAWNIALYKSWLKDEILEVKDFVLGVKTTKNYPKTIHNGIEVGFTLVPVQNIFTTRDKDEIRLRGVYNYSDFKFMAGEYEGKQLAGIPKHYLAGSLEYNYPGKLSLELNTEYQLEDTPIDHENTQIQPSFYLLGFKVNYLGIRNISLYVEGKNMLDKRYASSYIINDQIHAPPIPFPNFSAKNMAFFMPGSPRVFYVGITYSFQ